MSAYKDYKTGDWYCIFYYLDFKGKKKRKTKRGFKFKREALEWECNYRQLQRNLWQGVKNNYSQNASGFTNQMLKGNLRSVL